MRLCKGTSVLRTNSYERLRRARCDVGKGRRLRVGCGCCADAKSAGAAAPCCSRSCWAQASSGTSPIARRRCPTRPRWSLKMREVARLKTLDVSLYKKIDFTPDPREQATVWGALAQWASYTPAGRRADAPSSSRWRTSAWICASWTRASLRVRGAGWRWCCRGCRRRWSSGRRDGSHRIQPGTRSRRRSSSSGRATPSRRRPARTRPCRKGRGTRRASRCARSSSGLGFSEVAFVEKLFPSRSVADELARHWTLDPRDRLPQPRLVRRLPDARCSRRRRELRARMEREPVRFFVRELEPLLDEARARAGARSSAPTPTISRSCPTRPPASTPCCARSSFAPGDELLTTDHAYNACRNALDCVARAARARGWSSRTVPVPASRRRSRSSTRCSRAVTPRTRLALLDHVTSPTALVFPVAAARARARASAAWTRWSTARTRRAWCRSTSRALGAAYYTGNCHKWLCAPKGAAFLHVRRDRQARHPPARRSATAPTRRAPIARASGSSSTGPAPTIPRRRSASPTAIRFLGGLLPGGWPDADARATARSRSPRARPALRRRSASRRRARLDDGLARRGSPARLRGAASARTPFSWIRSRRRCSSGTGSRCR